MHIADVIHPNIHCAQKSSHWAVMSLK